MRGAANPEGSFTQDVGAPFMAPYPGLDESSPYIVFFKTSEPGPFGTGTDFKRGLPYGKIFDTLFLFSTCSNEQVQLRRKFEISVRVGGFMSMPGPMEVVVILLVVLLLFGAKRLPEIGKAFGDGIREFKKAIKDGTDSSNSDKK